jgi:hypothetical protein
MNPNSAGEIFEEIGTHLSSLKHTGRCPDDEIVTARLEKCKELLINLDGAFVILHLNYGELTEALCEQADEYINNAAKIFILEPHSEMAFSACSRRSADESCWWIW